MMTHSALTIGIFTDDFYPKSGGVVRSIELQIQELRALGHNVILFAPHVDFEPPNDCQSEGLPVWRLPDTESYLCSLRFGDALAERIARKYSFDIVHSQNERGAMFLAAKIAKANNIPHVHTFHSNYAGTHRTTPFWSGVNSLTYMALAPLMLRRIRPERATTKIYLPHKMPSIESTPMARSDWRNIAKLASFMDVFTSPAQFMIDGIVDASRNNLVNRAVVVPNGINAMFGDAERIRPLSDTYRFVSCGRLDPEKRVDVIIRAFAKLNRDDAELFIIGEGSESDELRHLAAKTVTRGSVQFLGHLNDIDRIAGELANSDAFIFASYRFDTQGMVLAEAAAAGAPIIYCDDRLHVGVSRDNALLVKPSMTAFASGMRTIMSDRARQQRMATASKRLGKHLTAHEMEKKFIAVYQKAIDARSE